MQPETEKTSHCTFPLGSYPFECLMVVFTFDMADAKRRRIDERYAGTFTRAAQLQEKCHFYDCFLLQFHEAIVTDGVGKMIPAMYLNIPGIKGFYVSEVFDAEQNKNRDDFAVRHCEFALTASFAAVFWEDVPCITGSKIRLNSSAK
jgi:hypothetical protein